MVSHELTHESSIDIDISVAIDDSCVTRADPTPGRLPTSRILDVVSALKSTGDDAGVTRYLSTAPQPGQDGYARIRVTVHNAAGADRVRERLSYKLPTFFVDGKRLLHVGLWGEHLAIYPVPDSKSDPQLATDLEPYRKGKGTLHFRYRDEWPEGLISRLVQAHLDRLC